MAYHILRIVLTLMRIPLVCGSSAPLDNNLFHKNVPMIIQSLGSNGHLSLIYSLILIAHSITSSLLCVIAPLRVPFFISPLQIVSFYRTAKLGEIIRPCSVLHFCIFCAPPCEAWQALQLVAVRN